MRDRPATAVSRLPTVTVRVQGVNGTKVLVIDSLGNEFEVDASVRRKGTGMPEQDERWVLMRRGNAWAFDALVGAPGRIEVGGSQEGLHPVSAQVLEVLRRHGLVKDSTLVSADPPLTAAVDPAPPAEVAEDDSEVIDSPDNPDVLPAKFDGPARGTADNAPEGWVPLFVGGYVQEASVGPRRAVSEMTRLNRSSVQVMAIHGAGGASRDGMFTRAEQMGWGVYRPAARDGSKDTALLWRTSDLTLVDSGSESLHPGGDNPGPSRRWPRSMNWVRLNHKAARRDFYVVGAHLLPHTEGHTSWHSPPFEPGQPSRDPNLAASVAATQAAVTMLRQRIRDFSKIGPTYLLVDTNIDFFADKAARTPNFPFARWSPIATCNWEALEHRPPYGTLGTRHVDSLWVVKPTVNHIRFRNQWVLTGYASDYKPFYVKTIVRRAT